MKPLSKAVLLASLALLFGACGHDIGDDCLSSADCDPNGTRACDLSQPGGYCTIAGCTDKSCPSESACIRYFPEMYLTQPCVAACEDIDCPPPGHRMNDCAADELCLNAGLCAKRSYETRQCAKTCGDNSDCRGGYECRKAGTRGSMLLTSDPLGQANFCAPNPATAQ